MKDKRSHTCKVNEDSYIKKSHVWAYKKRPMHLFIFLTNSKYTILLSTCIFHVELYFDLSFKLGSTFSMNWGFENNYYTLWYARLQIKDKKILGMAPLWIIHLSNGISCLNFQQLDRKRKKKKKKEGTGKNLMYDEGIWKERKFVKFTSINANSFQLLSIN